MSRILFSPIGRSDPIRDNFDGPMLHIVRHYKPRKAFLYFSKEMAAIHMRDDRFFRAIQRVMPNCIPHDIITDIVDVSDFLLFYNEFSAVLGDIHKNQPESEIIVNITSGTVQMNVALIVIVLTSALPLVPVQVKTHTYMSSDCAPHLPEEIDIDKELDNLLDNLDDAKNRTVRPDLTNYSRSYIMENIKKALLLHDYNGAYLLSQSDYVSPIQKKYIEACYNRYNIQTADLDGTSLSYPVETSNIKRLFEYYLVVRIKQKRGEVGDCIMRLTPLSCNLISAYLEKKYKVCESEFCYSAKNNQHKIDSEKIKKYNIELYKYIDSNTSGSFPSYISLQFWLYVFEYFLSKNSDVKSQQHYNSFKELRIIEMKVRNIVAHTIVSIDDDCVKRCTGFNLNEIIKKLDIIFISVFPNIKKEYYESYDVWNKETIKTLS